MEKDKIKYSCPECKSENLLMHGECILPPDNEICPFTFFCVCYDCNWSGHEQELSTNKDVIYNDIKHLEKWSKELVEKIGLKWNILDKIMTNIG